MLKKVKNNYISIIVVFVILLLTFIITMQSPLNIFSNKLISGTDSSVFRTVAYYMREGLMPYKDIFDHKGPIIYILNYIGMAISYNRGIWLIEFLSMFISLSFMYKTARLYCNKFLSILILILVTSPLFLFFEQGNLTEEYALPFISISFFIFLDYLKNNKISSFRLIACGISFGSVCLLRINMIPLWIVFCISIFIKELKDKNIRQLLRFCLYFILGILIIILPIFIWLIINDAFIPFFESYILFNLKYTSASSITLIDKLNSMDYFMTNSISLLVIAFSIFNIYKSRNFINISYIICLLLTYIFITLSGRTYPHYGMILIPLFIYPLAYSFYLNKGKNERFTLELITIILVFLFAFPSCFDGVIKASSDYNDRALNINNTSTTTEFAIAYDVISNTDEDDKITVFGNNNIIYLLSKRMSVSKYTYQFPILNVDKSIKKSYFTDLNEDKPKIIVKIYEDEAMKKFIEENNYVLISSYPYYDWNAEVYKIS